MFIFSLLPLQINSRNNIKNVTLTKKGKNNIIKFNYLLKEGVSTVKGGISVLSEMNYPKEIIDNANKDY
jgi:DNA mismatch repair ATPase MutS